MISKRVSDIALSAILLLVLSPFMLIVSIAIALTMGTPVVFRQKRPGWRSRPFHVFKFRTMTDCKDDNGLLLPDSHRITWLGRFLRDTSIDELPQLMNVLLGQMSLVGPRPLIKRFVENCTTEQMRRFDVRPGITGLAQITGRKGLDYDKRFELDVWYVDNYSVWLDLRILMATVIVVCRKDGIEESCRIPGLSISEHPAPSAGLRRPAMSPKSDRVRSRDTRDVMLRLEEYIATRAGSEREPVLD